MTNGQKIAIGMAKTGNTNARDLAERAGVNYHDLSRLKNDQITWYVFKRRNNGADNLLKLLRLSEDAEDRKIAKQKKMLKESKRKGNKA